MTQEILRTDYSLMVWLLWTISTRKKQSDYCPKVSIGSFLFDIEDIKAEFDDFKIVCTQTLTKEDIMHHKKYQRVTHAVIMKKH